MSQVPIYFEFSEQATASLALDTLGELGYHAHVQTIRGTPVIQLFIEHNDLTSALEIAQAYGGLLLDTEQGDAYADSYASAYELDAVPIPAHVVNEDWPESYYTGESAGLSAPLEDERDGLERFDPSGDDYDRFSAGVRV
ncbi:hypothetical protein ACFFNY_30950 [Paenibacillus hodogayensis]|uniref:DNA/RNA helicase n=1 Tax=Paenibacillus hodogayensis TaxID=279208 RepID=A0ABV5W628_9BACL